VRRATTVVLALGVALAGAPAAQGKTRARGPASQLGAAYRAFEDGAYQKALKLARSIDRARVRNGDYVAYLAGQSAFLVGDVEGALRDFQLLAGSNDSRFRSWAAWRVADCLWQLDRIDPARKAYAALVARDVAGGDRALARFRMAEADVRAGKTAAALRAFQDLRQEHPGHMLDEVAAARLEELGGPRAARLEVSDRISRAIQLKLGKKWDLAIAELMQIGDDQPPPIRRQRDFWLAMTLFKMRRQYGRAAGILLGLYKDMGDRAGEALFHGARALSRADRDPEAIVQYQKLVAEYPRSEWAPEAQYLSGWLEFNAGRYKQALPGLEETRSASALQVRRRGALVHRLRPLHDRRSRGRAAPVRHPVASGATGSRAARGCTGTPAPCRSSSARRSPRRVPALVGRFPLSWYALLARARLAEKGETIDPFGDRPRPSDGRHPVAGSVDEKLAADPLIQRVDELVVAGLGGSPARSSSAARRRSSSGTRGRRGSRCCSTATARRQLRAPLAARRLVRRHPGLRRSAQGAGRVWWENSLPLAYRDLIEKHRPLGGSPDYYLWAIMRKESGFDPHTHSYADAIGLLQMIPPTTRRVAPRLGLTYTDDFLFDPRTTSRAAPGTSGGCSASSRARSRSARAPSTAGRARSCAGSTRTEIARWTRWSSWSPTPRRAST
jgi:soluble lytic murein transglycosylase